MMKSANNKKASAIIKIILYPFAWIVLYGAPTAVFHAGFADGPHVLLEGLAALLLLVPFLRDEPLPREDGKPRYRLVFLILVPMAALRFSASGIFCHAGASFHTGSMDAALGPGMYKWYVLRTCVTAPLMEELGCRWIAFGKTRRLTGFWPAALLSTALFSLIHLGVDPALAVSVIPGALLRCLEYELTGKLGCCVAEHAIFNVLCLPDAPWVTPGWANRYAGVPEWTGTPVLVVVTIIIILLCAFREKLFFRDENGGSR